jgi:hypothetical protein
MRTLHHPIAVFVLTVLAVIGVGVAVVAATQTSRVYGPSWGRFTAVFAGHVYQRRGHMSMAYAVGSSASSPFRSTLTLTLADYSYSNLRGGWVGYLPRAAETVSVIRGMPLGPAVADAKKGFPGAGVTEVKQDANGLSVITLGPQCAIGPCMALKVVSNGQVLWTVVAVSTAPSTALVESFLASFQPIG